MLYIYLFASLSVFPQKYMFQSSKGFVVLFTVLTLVFRTAPGTWLALNKYLRKEWANEGIGGGAVTRKE